MMWLKNGLSESENETDDGASEASNSNKRTEKQLSRLDSKRQEILNVAREQFLKNGFADTSVDSIVEILGGSKSTIYSHFGNKKALFAAVIRSSGNSAQVKDLLVANGNVRDELLSFALDRAETVLSNDLIAIMRMVIAEAGRQPKLAALFYRNAPELTYSVLKDYLERATKRGDLSVKDSKQASEQFLGELLQWRLLAKLFGASDKISKKSSDARITTQVDQFIDLHSPNYL